MDLTKLTTNTPEIPKKLKGTIALLTVKTYGQWLKEVGPKTRNMIRKAEKTGVITRIATPDEDLARGMWAIYNETPIRQNRAFKHYGRTLESVQTQIVGSPDVFVGAYFHEKLVGFAQLSVNKKTVVITQILSLVSYRDKAVNNVVIAKTVEFCADHGYVFVVYARFGNHPSLDRFKRNNGFKTWNVGGHTGLKDLLHPAAKKMLIPVYNWASRKTCRKQKNRLESE
jgi:hypothetical protein